MTLIAAHLNAEVILVVTVSAVSLFPTSMPPPPFSPSLISLIASVDVKSPCLLIYDSYLNVKVILVVSCSDR